VFFRVLRDEDSRRADYAQELIARRTSTGARMADTATPGDRRTSEEMAAGGSQRTASAGPAPGAGDIPPPSMEEQEAQPTQAGTEGAVHLMGESRYTEEEKNPASSLDSRLKIIDNCPY
jgi:hypothetical protein